MASAFLTLRHTLRVARQTPAIATLRQGRLFATGANRLAPLSHPATHGLHNDSQSKSRASTSAQESTDSSLALSLPNGTSIAEATLLPALHVGKAWTAATGSQSLAQLPLTASPQQLLQAHARALSTSSRPLNASSSHNKKSSLASSTTETDSKASPGGSGGGDGEDDEERDRKAMQGLTAMQKFRYMLRRYGKFAAVYYFVLGLADLSLYYTAISMGVDVQPFLDAIFNTFGGSPDWISPKYGTLIAAYSVHKVMTVPRVLLVVSTTPSIIKRIKISYPGFYQRFLR